MRRPALIFMLAGLVGALVAVPVTVYPRVQRCPAFDGSGMVPGS
jgi:hypothetical protein